MMKATHEKHPLVELVVIPEKATRGDNVFQITVHDILTTVCQYTFGFVNICINYLLQFHVLFVNKDLS